jgi:hypothetical protein
MIAATIREVWEGFPLLPRRHRARDGPTGDNPMMRWSPTVRLFILIAASFLLWTMVAAVVLIFVVRPSMHW